jgi:ATP-binding cassette subfamily F protein uup
VETLELLEEMLVDYAGTVILISHDRTFLNNIVSSTIVMEGEAVIEQYIGGYDDYLRQRSEQLEQKNKAKTTTTVANKPKKVQTKLSYKEQQQLNELPRKIEDLENSITTSQEQLSDPTFYQNPDAQNITIELSKMELELEQMYDKWSELDNG